MRKLVSRMLPAFLKSALKKSYWYVVDLVDELKGRDSLTPPRSLIYVGAGDYRKIGNEFRRYFIELADLKPDARVLDVGCGIGRMAIPLADYLSPGGEYHGFDIVKKGIDWCQAHVSSRFANFHFRHVDIYNKMYNREGKLQARELRFPFEDGHFDFVFLTSVFTHMVPADVENYLSEVSRVLRVGGKCLITFFLLNGESRELIRAGRSALKFRHEFKGCLVAEPDNPESVISYDEEFVRKMFSTNGLEIIDPIHYGSWCRRPTFLSFQDILIAVRTDTAERSAS